MNTQALSHSGVFASLEKLDLLSLIFNDVNFREAKIENIPPLWHWAAFSQWSRPSDMRFDGHLQSVSPPVEDFGIARRLFAGGETTFATPFAIGQEVHLQRTVSDVTVKQGRSGEFVLVRELIHAQDTQTGVTLFKEFQDVIYQKIASNSIQSEPQTLTVKSKQLRNRYLEQVNENLWAFNTDPTLLMRFSAATANSHRIHYDWEYTTTIEKHQGLVVHGPLMTLMMQDVFRQDFPEQWVQRMQYRHHNPLYCGHPAFIRYQNTADHQKELQLFTLAEDGSTEKIHSTLTVFV